MLGTCAKANHTANTACLPHQVCVHNLLRLQQLEAARHVAKQVQQAQHVLLVVLWLPPKCLPGQRSPACMARHNAHPQVVKVGQDNSSRCSRLALVADRMQTQTRVNARFFRQPLTTFNCPPVTFARVDWGCAQVRQR